MINEIANRWHSIKDALPEDGADVLLFLMDGSIIQTTWSNDTHLSATVDMNFLNGRYPRFWVEVVKSSR